MILSCCKQGYVRKAHHSSCFSESIPQVLNAIAAACFSLCAAERRAHWLCSAEWVWHAAGGKKGMCILRDLVKSRHPHSQEASMCGSRQAANELPPALPLESGSVVSQPLTVQVLDFSSFKFRNILPVSFLLFHQAFTIVKCGVNASFFISFCSLIALSNSASISLMRNCNSFSITTCLSWSKKSIRRKALSGYSSILAWTCRPALI